MCIVKGFWSILIGKQAEPKDGPPRDLPWTPANAWLREPITEENRKKLRKIASLQQDENINKKKE